MFNSKEKYQPKPIEDVVDPTTGEIIHRVALSPDLIKGIEDTIKAHSQTMNEFVMNSNTYFEILERQLELRKKIKVADEAIKNRMQDAMKKSKLDAKQPWAFNMQMKVFERRTPPIVPGMSPQEIHNSQNPGQKPVLVETNGIGVK